MDIFSLCLQHDIFLLPEWVPLNKNTEADALSRIIDYDDWSLSHDQFLTLDNSWGPHTIDRFATDHSKQLSRFNSRYFCPGTSGIDAFLFDWAGENNWLCPPVSQIVAVIRHVQTCQAQGTLLVPEWPSSYFWPTLFKDGIHFGRGLTNWIRISNPTFIPSRLEGKSVFNGETHFNMLALRLDFSPSAGNKRHQFCLRGGCSQCANNI